MVYPLYHWENRFNSWDDEIIKYLKDVNKIRILAPLTNEFKSKFERLKAASSSVVLVLRISVAVCVSEWLQMGFFSSMKCWKYSKSVQTLIWKPTCQRWLRNFTKGCYAAKEGVIITPSLPQNMGRYSQIFLYIFFCSSVLVIMVLIAIYPKVIPNVWEARSLSRLFINKYDLDVAEKVVENPTKSTI